jgi:hypothetical protein
MAADLLFAIPKIGSASPFAGIKRYNLAPSDGSGLSTFADATSTDATGHFGLGVDLDAGRFSVTAEAGDYISNFRQRTVVRAESGEPVSLSAGSWQHDIALSVGITVGVP